MPVTEQQARALAFLACAIRPHGAPRWDEGGVFANVMKVADRSLATVALAVVQAAEDRNAATPGVIAAAGPHWRPPEAAPPRETRTWTAAGFCHVCGQSVAGHRLTDHEPLSAAEYAAQLAKAPIDTARAVAGLRDVKATPPPVPPQPSTTAASVAPRGADQ